MNFQNCILINFVTDGRTDKPKAICPVNFSKIGGMITTHTEFDGILDKSNTRSTITRSSKYQYWDSGLLIFCVRKEK